MDPNSYNGLVFLGLCYAELKESQSSKQAYHDAIAQENSQSLAYQGLVNLYTKHWSGDLSKENRNDLIDAYKKLVKLLGK